ELTEDDLARNGLRDLEHGREVEGFDLRAGRARRTGHRFFPPGGRIHPGEVPHLSISAPTQVAVPRVSQIRVSNRLKAARRIEPRGQLIGESRVLDKAALARQPN